MHTLDAMSLFLANRRAKGCTKSYQDWLERNLKRFAADNPELPLEPESLENYWSIIPDHQDEVRHAQYRCLRVLYRFLYRRHKISNNPFDFLDPPIKRPKIQPTLEPGEMLLLSVRAKNARDRAIFTLLFDTGIRATELVTLTKQHVFADRILVIGKGGEREVPISEETHQLLVLLIIHESDYVFRGQRGPLTYSGLYRIVKKYLAEIGITGPKMGPLRLRHTLGRTFLENGGDTRTLQKIMGHSSLESTQIYTNLSNQSLIAMHHRFTPLRTIYGAARTSFFQQEQGN